MDKAFDALGDKFTPAEKRKINREGIEPFYKTLRKNIENRSVPYVQDEHRRYKPDRTKLLSTLDTNYTDDDGVEVGFTKKGKQAYLGRFMNDGWDVRNQHGGPWRHVEGEHFWERTQSETSYKVTKAEMKALKEVMNNRMRQSGVKMT